MSCLSHHYISSHTTSVFKVLLNIITISKYLTHSKKIPYNVTAGILVIALRVCLFTLPGLDLIN